jgi:hypothetical protein
MRTSIDGDVGCDRDLEDASTGRKMLGKLMPKFFRMENNWHCFPKECVGIAPRHLRRLFAAASEVGGSGKSSGLFAGSKKSDRRMGAYIRVQRKDD